MSIEKKAALDRPGEAFELLGREVVVVLDVIPITPADQ
jgi:hypothetical protein